MKAHFTRALILTLALATPAIASAATVSHDGTTTGPRGGITSSIGSTSCSGGACSHLRTTTYPNGMTSSASSSGSCAGGTCSRSATRTGPRGASATHTGTTTRDEARRQP